METVKKVNKNILIPLAVLAIATVALASVFVYYPLTLQAQPQAPGVVFQPGSNAGHPDIGQNTITVNLGANATSATVRIHPTYQRTYYLDVLRVHNGDNDAMRIWLRVESIQNSLPQGSVVRMIFRQGNTVVYTHEFANAGVQVHVGTINAGATWQIDFEVIIPEGTRIANAQFNAQMRLIYTPSTETPPQ